MASAHGKWHQAAGERYCSTGQTMRRFRRLTINDKYGTRASDAYISFKSLQLKVPRFSLRKLSRSPNIPCISRYYRGCMSCPFRRVARQSPATTPRRDANTIERRGMQYSQEVENMCPVAKVHTTAPHPSPRRQVVQAKEISDISGLTHGVGWCAPQQRLQAHAERQGRHHRGGPR